MKIQNIKAREILDSRGLPTIEVDVVLDDGALGRFAVPSGASTGEHEALELRDLDPKRYLGKGVLKAVENVVGSLSALLVGKECGSQRVIDDLMCEADGTPNKSKFGANAILGVSVAVAKARAASLRLPLYASLEGFHSNLLPVPLMNVLNGGVHADNGLDVQEFMIAPVGASSFQEALRWGAEVYQHLKAVLKQSKKATAVGDEGGFAPVLTSNIEALDLLSIAVEKSGLKLGADILLAVDAAASEWFDKQERVYRMREHGVMSPQKLVNMWEAWCRQYPLFSIEDGMDENDWQGWQQLTTCLGHQVQLVGDDLFVTNTERLKQGIESNVANAILIKLNQIGTLTQTLDVIKLAKENGYKTIMSHRSGETEDTSIADIAVATGCGQIKTGASARTERLCKYNQLLRIEEELGDNAVYAGNQIRRG